MTDTPEVPKGLRPANENPWYVLMTLHGEQKGEEIDWDVHEENRRAWNAWAGQSLGSEKLWKIADQFFNGNNSEIDGWRKLHGEIERRFKARGHSTSLPRPTESVNLSRLEIDAHLVLDGMIFDSDLCVTKAKVARDLSGGGSGFFGRIDLSKTQIGGATRWNKMFVKGDLTAAETKFALITEAKSATFSGDVNFTKATFQKNSDRNASVDFAGSKIGGNLRLRGMVVEGSLCFGDCEVEGRVEAEKLFVQDGFHCNSAVFRSRVTFNQAEFRGLPVTFFGSDFHQPVDFRKASFQETYPDFTSALLHDRMSFTTRMQSSQDERNTDKEPLAQIYWPETPRQNPEASRESCATIRHVLTKQGLPEEAHFFFRREMHFAGLPSEGRSWAEQLPYILFGWFSDYGYSIQRPLVWLLCLWAFGVAAFWGYLAGCCAPAPLEAVEHPMGTAMALSFSNLFPLFGFGRALLGEVLRELPPVLKTLSGAQTVLSLPLLFFLGLGLRQRFRLR